MEIKSPWPLALKYALVLAFSYITISLVFYLVSSGSFDGEWGLSGILQQLLILIAMGYILFISAKARRTQDLNGEMTYGQSLGFMMITSLVASFIIALYSYIFATYIAPELMEKAMNVQTEKMSKKGLSDEEIENAIKISKMFTHPLIMMLGSMIWTMLVSFILALIASIFAKKDPKIYE